MKDVIHHLRYVQKKVLQSVRKSENSSIETKTPTNGQPVLLEETSSSRRRLRKKQSL